MFRGSVKSWFWILLLAGGGAALLLFRGSESDRIRSQLYDLADVVAFQGRPPPAAWIGNLQSKLMPTLADPVTLDVAPDGEMSFTKDLLLEGIVAYASNYAGLLVKLNHVSVTVDSTGARATAKGEAMVELVEPSNERRGEPRRFAASFAKRDHGWVLVHAKISEPRVDEPEARP